MYESSTARWFRRVTLALITLFALFPVFIILETTVKPLKDVQNTFQWIPSHVTFAPYREIWSTVPLLHYFLNSLIVSTISTVVAVSLAVFAGYAISRFDFRGRRAFSLAVLSTQMFPGILFLLPLYLIYVNIGRTIGINLYGSYLGLIITYLTFALPFSVWMLAGFFSSIPRELEEAAMVDGTSPWGALFRIVLPIARPGIVGRGSVRLRPDHPIHANPGDRPAGVRHRGQHCLESAHGGSRRGQRPDRDHLPGPAAPPDPRLDLRVGQGLTHAKGMRWRR
jgi:multiple sugar transport system permease protein